MAGPDIKISNSSPAISPTRISAVMDSLQSRMASELPLSRFGFSKVVSECDAITVQVVEGSPQFVLQTPKRKLTADSPNGDNFNDLESSIVIRSWLKKKNVPSRVVRSLIRGCFDHVCLEVPGRGFLGVTPVDKRLTRQDHVNLRVLGESELKKAINPEARFMPIPDLMPMQWERGDGKRSILVSAGMEYDCGKRSQRSSVSALRFSVQAFNGNELEKGYIYRLVTPRESLTLLRHMAEQKGPKGILDLYRHDMKLPFEVDDLGFPQEEFMQLMLRRYEPLFHQMIMKLDVSALSAQKSRPRPIYVPPTD